MSFDEANQKLEVLISEITMQKITSETLSETDTRVKIIDTILKEILFWPEDSISREDRTTDKDKVKFTDYQIKLGNRPYIVIEAKKSGKDILLPLDSKRKTKIKNLIKNNGYLSSAIMQCRGYCDDCAIRYSIVTNGLSWIVFKAIRDDIPWKEGDSMIFNNLSDIHDHFIEFYNLLAFENVNRNSLENQFSTRSFKTRNMSRILEKLHAADKPLERNRLHTHLDKIIEFYFKDIADNEYMDLLKDCYIYSDDNSFNDFSSRIRDEIPYFLKSSSISDVVTTRITSGELSDIMHESVEIHIGKLLLILGGIGAGKTTFLKRFFRLTDADFLNRRAVWFYISFLGPPSDFMEIDKFIYQRILDTIRENYHEVLVEDRKTIKKAFKNDIERLNLSVFEPEHLDASEIEKRLTSKIMEWQIDIPNYTKKLLKLIPIRGRALVICLDNVDQLPPLYQERVFLAAQNIFRETNSIVILALREETFYSARTQHTFTAYSNQKYHIVSPNFMKLIGKRISFAIKDIRGPNNIFPNKRSIDLQTKEDILDFLTIIEQSLFKNNKALVKFINSMCFGNMRLALEYFAKFLLSGATYVDKMLGIYRSQGNYTIAFHEFIKSIMIDDRYYYSDSKSSILNVFNCTTERNSSHFTAIRILNYLNSRKSIYSNEGNGFVVIDTMLEMFQEVFNDRSDVISTCNNLLNRSLIETNTKASDSIDNSSHIRITSAGQYYHFLVKKFVYLDLVLIDTPINDDVYLEKLFKISLDIENIPEYEKIKKTMRRFDRTDLFIKYLAKEEKDEEVSYPEIKNYDDFKDNITASILAGFETDKRFIVESIRRNRSDEGSNNIDEFTEMNFDEVQDSFNDEKNWKDPQA
jgi:hypothetical protein